MNAGILMMIFIIAIANIGGIYFYLQDKKQNQVQKLAPGAKPFPLHARFAPDARFCVRWEFWFIGGRFVSASLSSLCAQGVPFLHTIGRTD